MCQFESRVRPIGRIGRMSLRRMRRCGTQRRSARDQRGEREPVVLGPDRHLAAILLHDVPD